MDIKLTVNVSQSNSNDTYKTKEEYDSQTEKLIREYLAFVDKIPPDKYILMMREQQFRKMYHGY